MDDDPILVVDGANVCEPKRWTDDDYDFGWKSSISSTQKMDG